MKRYYYITFCWNRELLYDGYFMNMGDNRIIGFTDESILVGSATKISEISEVEMFEYEIHQKRYANTKKIHMNFVIGDNNIAVTIKKGIQYRRRNNSGKNQ